MHKIGRRSGWPEGDICGAYYGAHALVHERHDLTLLLSFYYNVPLPPETSRLCATYSGNDKFVLRSQLLPHRPSGILEVIVSELSTLLSQRARRSACTE